MEGKKTGGRQKGTPNKATAQMKSVICAMVQSYQESGQMDCDLQSLEPKERIGIMEKLMQYVLPRMKSVEVDLSVGDSSSGIEERLRSLCEPGGCGLVE